MTIKMNSGKIHALDVDGLEVLENFRRLVKKYLVHIAVGLVVAVKMDFLNPKSAMYSGIAIFSFIAFSFFTKGPK